MKPLVQSSGGVPLAFARSPFSDDVHRSELPYGLTVSEIISTVPDLPDRFWAHGVVCLNYVKDGQAHCDPIPRAFWNIVRLKEKPVPTTLTLHLPLAGGGSRDGGGKNTFSLIASVALLAATAAITAGAAAPLLGASFAAGTFGASALAGGIGILGALAISALSAPPVLEEDEQRERRFGDASASGNALVRGGVIPRVIGKRRLSPPFACQPLIDISGGDEVVEAVYCMSGPHLWANLRNEGVPFGSDGAYVWEVREGFATDEPLTLVTRQGFTDAPALELSEHDISTDDEEGVALNDQTTPDNSLPRWHTIVARRQADEIWLTLVMPEGFLFADFPTITVNVPVRIRIRPRGTTPWFNLPEVHFSWRGGSLFRKAIKLKWEAAPALPLVTPREAFAPIYAFKGVPTQDVAPIGTGGWLANSYFHAAPGSNLYSAATVGTTNVRNMGMFYDRVEFYLSSGGSSLLEVPKVSLETGVGAVYEIQIMRGQPINHDAFDPVNYLTTGTPAGVFDFFGYWSNPAETNEHQILSNAQNTRKKIILARTASVWNEPPVSGTGLALLAVKARNKTLQDVSADLSGYVPDALGSDDYIVSSNPALNYQDVLTGGQNADPLPEDLIDTASINSWKTRCDDENFTVNMVASGQSAAELLKIIAGCGYARPRQSEKWGVIQDKDRSEEAVAQVFTPRNMAAGFRFEKAFPVLPHGFRVRFPNIAKEYEEDEIVVYDEDGGFSAANAERLEEVSYEGIVTEDAAARRASFDLRQIRLRSTRFQADVDVEALVTTRGDLVGVQHDVLTHEAGFARIKEKLASGGLVQGLILDSKIPTQVGADFFSLADVFTTPDIFALEGTTGIAIRYKDGSGTVIAESLSDPAGETDEIEFTTPFADPGDDVLGEGCLIASGSLGSEYRRLIIADIQPSPDLRAALTLVDEAEDLWPHTAFGQGSVNILFAVTGESSRVPNAGGNVASVLTVAAAGTIHHMRGQGTVAIQLSATGAATSINRAAGSVAFVLSVTGSATVRAGDSGFDLGFDTGFG